MAIYLCYSVKNSLLRIELIMESITTFVTHQLKDDCHETFHSYRHTCQYLQF